MTANQQFIVTVNAQGTPIAVGTIPNQTVNAGASVNVSLGGYFSDPDSDSLTYTAESFYTSRATVSVFLGATLTINGVNAGIARIEVTAADPGGLTANQQFTVTVNAQGNQAPTTVGTIPNQTVNVGASVNVSLGGYFNDPDSDTLTYTAESFYTSRGTVSVLGATLTINGVATGIAQISATATDPGGLSATQTFTVTVGTQGNQAPTTVGTISNQAVTVGSSTTVGSLGSYFNDPDSDTLTYTATSGYMSRATVSVLDATLTINGVDAGIARIEVTAADPGGLTANQQFTVTVNAQGTPIAVGTIPNQTVNVGASVNVSLGGYFNDPDSDTLTYSATSGYTSRATVSVLGATLTINGVATGIAQISATATDPGGLSATQTFTVTIPVQSDVNGDGAIDISDLVYVGINFGATGEGLAADIDGNGVVDIFDLVRVARLFGQSSIVSAAPTAHTTSGRFGYATTRQSMQQVGIYGPTTPIDSDSFRRLRSALTELERISDVMPEVRMGADLLRNWLSTNAGIPAKTQLLPNYPNPFNPETWIPYHLDRDTDASLSIYNAGGVLVGHFDLGHQSAGFYTEKGNAVYWDGQNERGEAVASGIYFYQLRTGDYSAMRRMTIVK